MPGRSAVPNVLHTYALKVGKTPVSLYEQTINVNTVSVTASPEDKAPVYVGGKGVTVENGYRLDPGRSVAIPISMTCARSTR